MDNEEIKRLAEKVKASGGESWLLLAIMALFGFNDCKLEQNE
jgi:hypothetical protein